MRGIIWAALSCLTMSPSLCVAQDVTAGSLPPPAITSNSVEICLNSRYSQHTLSRTAAGPQQIANILWAAGRAPVTGTYRRIYAATPSGTYLYDPNNHSLNRYSDEAVSDGGFAILYETQGDFDAGVLFMPAMLAAVSLGRSTESAVASCPKGLGFPKTRLFFGVQPVADLTTSLAARCSVAPDEPGWLPDPMMTGDNSLETVLANLRYINRFARTNLTLQETSQILWAGYGCTAHMTTNGRAGLTVPSAFANYYLSGSIYLVDEDGVRRYQNRTPGLSPATRDHRLETLAPPAPGRRPRSEEGGGASQPVDARAALRTAVNRLPEAPCYIVLCLDSSSAGQHYAQLETGFAAVDYLIQATALGLGCYFTPNLTSAEQQAVRTATAIPATHIPQVIVSIGAAAMPGDADGDDTVDLADYAILSRCWLLSKSWTGYDARADFDGDGFVGLADLSLLAMNWLRTR